MRRTRWCWRRRTGVPLRRGHAERKTRCLRACRTAWAANQRSVVVQPSRGVTPSALIASKASRSPACPWRAAIVLHRALPKSLDTLSSQPDGTRGRGSGMRDCCHGADGPRGAAGYPGHIVGETGQGEVRPDIRRLDIRNTEAMGAPSLPVQVRAVSPRRFRRARAARERADRSAWRARARGGSRRGACSRSASRCGR